MKQEPVAYRVYMLRFWMMDNDGCPQWRLSLEGVHGDAPYTSTTSPIWPSFY